MTPAQPNRPLVPKFDTPGEQHITCEIFAQQHPALQAGTITDKLLIGRLLGHAKTCPTCSKKIA